MNLLTKCKPKKPKKQCKNIKNVYKDNVRISNKTRLYFKDVYNQWML